MKIETRIEFVGLIASLVMAVGCTPEPKGGASSASAAKTTAAAPASAAEEKMELPFDLGKVPVPEDNPQSEAKVKLGNQLFFDKRLSKDGTRSCYSCHLNEDGNGGKDPIAIGAEEKKLTRHSPVIWNVGYLGSHYWDGRAPSLEAQATGAWSGGNMGVGKENLEAKAKEIEKIEGYKKQFDAVFPGVGVTPDTIVKSLAAYERTLVCDNTVYDKYAKGDAKAFNDEQKKGLDLFLGKAGCVNCHNPPFFSAAYGSKEGAYYNAGIGTKDKKEEEVDVGRFSVSKKDADWAAFKVPSLRNVSKSAPYFHDGSVAKLEDAVSLMAGGGIKNKNLSALLTEKNLTTDDIKAIVAFLGTLDCGKTLVEPELPK